VIDYGHPVRFGYFLTPQADPSVLEIAEEADLLGLDVIGIQDHPYQRRFADTFTLMTMVLARTSRVHVFPDVANLPLRPPAMLAKAIASMDLFSGGRVELGLGAGGFWDAIEAYGGPRRTPGEARAALAEAIQVMRLLWSGQPSLQFKGEHYRLGGVQSGPAPAHPVGIWLGVSGPRALTLAGQLADGWVPSSPYVPPDALIEGHRRIDEAAQAAGRDPAEIRRIYNVAGVIDERATRGFLHGSVAQWVDELTELAVSYGIDTFVFAGEPAQLGAFAREVVPAVREQVATERG
jgi:alkanesulfonate monooxygenase SsuD/methylene tetrahydromethanopterin reductase-like flavin-dependent oxidoreductase (luciferase family)